MASEGLTDPNFREAVVLLLAHGAEDGAMGVIVNRRGALRVNEVVTEVPPEMEGREDRLYQGGPVSLDTVTVLTHHALAGEDASREVLPGVHWAQDAEAFQAVLRQGMAESDLRIYAGYAGWAPGQLEAEIAAGGWFVVTADAARVFSPAPEAVWRLLLRLATLPVA